MLTELFIIKMFHERYIKTRNNDNDANRLT